MRQRENNLTTYSYHAMRLLAITTLLLALIGCNRVVTPNIEGDIPLPTTTIADLKHILGSKKSVVISDEVVIQGRVTSSDRDGNFYRAIIVKDNSASMELLVGQYDLYALYPEGLLLSLNLKGCAMDYDYGVLRVGKRANDYDSYDVTYISSREDRDRIIKRSTDVAPIEPRHTTIAELKRDECGELVRIENLTLSHTTSIDTLQGMTLSDATWQGYALFFDPNGDSIAVYTSPNARFAKNYIPTTPISITGIQQYCKYNGGKECYHLKLRYTDDYEAL